MALNEKELNEVSGGYGPWQQYAKGTYVSVTVQQICQWNNIKNPDLIYINQKLTIYPTILR